MATTGEFARVMNLRIQLDQMQGLPSHKKEELLRCLENIELNLLNWGDHYENHFDDLSILELRPRTTTNIENFKDDIFAIIDTLEHFVCKETTEQDQSFDNGFKGIILFNLKSILSILNNRTVS
jgi:molecular chaperone GrpE (heat shock protein)